MKTSYIIPIIGSILIPCTLFYLSRDRVNVRYTLSEPIKTPDSKGGNIWQQIVVKNNGNAEAKNVQIKMDKTVLVYEVSKNSTADTYQVYNDKYFELVYPILPPEGAITLTLGTEKERLYLNNILVLHSKGKGVEVFSYTGEWVVSFLWLTIVICVMFCGFMLVKYETKEILLRRAHWNPLAILKKKSSIFFDRESWLALRKDAIEYYFQRAESGEICLLSSYVFLSEDRPSYLSNEEWINAQKEAISNLKRKITEELKYITYLSIDSISPLLSMQKPKYIPDETWREIRCSIEDKYYELKTKKYKSFMYDLKDCARVIQEGKPKDFINERAWNEYIGDVRTMYFDKLLHKIINSNKPFDIITQNDISILDASDQMMLREKAYQVGTMCFFPSFTENEGLKQFLKNSKPEWIKDKDYESYRNLAQTILTMRSLKIEYEDGISQIAKDKTKLHEKEHELSEKISIIDFQLNIINEIFNDPHVLDRIESYKNTFAPSNFEKLKKIISILYAK